ncbi:protein lethal(2)essential for life-like [Anabrus simplex]|uniref:protein lethal(2)essential for life-like n=1 Tax=Anabrus simplex TaxID=316456 RepID=UPI0035A31E3E
MYYCPVLRGGHHGYYNRSKLQPLFHQPLDHGLSGDYFRPSCSTLLPHSTMYHRPWRHHTIHHSVISEKNGFIVHLDVQQFKPNEIVVKVMNRCVVVEAQHEQREDEHGLVSRHFRRRFSIPDDVDPHMVMATLSSDGILSIGAPKKVKKAVQPSGNERVVSLILTNAPAATHENVETIKDDIKTDTVERMDQ